MKISVLVFFIIISFSCNSKKHTGKKIQKENLIGGWTDGRSENASFFFEEDSMVMTQPSARYAYKLKDDSITIIYPETIFKGVLSFIGDTLVLTDPEFGPAKYVRVKEH